MKLPDLFGKASSGKIKLWRGEVVDNGDGTASIFVDHGYEGGSIQTEEKVIVEGKNIGKANETTPYEQAVSELKSDWNKKIDQGYVEDKSTIADYSEAEKWLPMLAKVWEDAKQHVVFPGYVQAKLDGARCLTTAAKQNGVVTMWSRQGKDITIPTKIRDELQATLEEGQSTDGELYVHGWTFQRVISAVKKKCPDTDLLEYHIYDFPSKTLTFKERFADIDKSKFTGQLKIVEAYPVTNQTEIDQFEEQFVNESYEGLMFRNSAGLYKFKHRSQDLLKCKRFQSSEFKIIGGKEGSGRDAGTVIFTMLNDDGVTTFEARPAATHEERSLWYDNLDKSIGEMATIKYFGRSEEGTPRFPVMVGYRPAWDM